MSNDIFISCKNLDEDGVQTRDAEIAAEVYDFLTGKGLTVFLSTFTLEQLGASEYTTAINSALESASVLVAIGTSADHLNSEWVKYEWDSFANEIRSRRKQNGRVFTYIEGMLIGDLPWTLRQTQTFVHRKDSLQRLYSFINKALPPSTAGRREREEKERTPTPTPTPSLVSSDPAFYYNRGRDFRHKKEYDKAISDFNKTIRLDPIHATAYYERGYAYGEKKEYDKAIRDYTDAIRLNPNYADAYHDRGFAYLKKKEYDKAIRDFTDAIRLHPNNPELYEARGFAYREKKEYDKAIKDYTDVIRLYPNFGSGYYDRGLAYYGKKEYDKAIGDYTEAIRLQPNYADAYFNRGLAYDKQGNKAQAQTDFDTAKKLGSPQ